MGLGFEDKNNRRDFSERKEKSGNNSKQTKALKCHICGKMGHTTVTTARGNKIVPYYVCEVFINMSPWERLQKLKSKNLCVGCLPSRSHERPKA